ACPESLKKACILHSMVEEETERRAQEKFGDRSPPGRLAGDHSQSQLSDDFTQVFDASRSATPTPSRMPPLAEWSRLFTKSHHITQMQQIASRKTTISNTVDGLISRRLSHTHSPSIVDTVIDSGMVIGLSVEEGTTENTPDDLPSCCGSVKRVVLFVPSRARTSTSLSRKASLMAKAKELT
ncbi:hypothetical protein EDD85DRAFT_826015, partial [Armillaria nabsnona]